MVATLSISSSTLETHTAKNWWDGSIRSKLRSVHAGTDRWKHFADRKAETPASRGPRSAAVFVPESDSFGPSVPFLQQQQGEIRGDGKAGLRVG